MQRLSHARSAVLRSDRPERCSYLVAHVEGHPVYEAVHALPTKNRFDFGEHSLDRIGFRAVASVEAGSDVELRVPRLQGFGFVNVEPVHEQRDRALAVLSPERL